jgi:heterogeneous nuclear rnp K-like protein 2
VLVIRPPNIQLPTDRRSIIIMSASPPAAMPSQNKRPLEEPSSPNGPGDQPDAKRPALDKVIKDDIATSNDAAPAIPVSSSDSVKPEAEAEVKPEQNGATDGQGDTVVPDAPTAILPIPGNQTPSVNGSSAQGQSRQDESGWLHVRAIISSAEAATVIGKGGENVSLIRRMSAARCTVSDYARGAVERILTVSGQVDAVAKVCEPSCE